MAKNSLILSDDFHRNSPHPNAKGYKILRKCSSETLEKLVFYFE